MKGIWKSKGGETEGGRSWDFERGGDANTFFFFATVLSLFCYQIRQEEGEKKKKEKEKKLLYILVH